MVAGGLAGALVVVAAGVWATVDRRWDRIELEGGFPPFLQVLVVVVGGGLAALIGADLSAWVGHAVARVRPGSRLLARLAATWIIAALPMVLATTDHGSWTKVAPWWTATVGTACTVLWVVEAAVGRRYMVRRKRPPTS